MKNPSTRQSNRKGNGPFRFWIPTDFDPSLLGNLITTTAQTSKGIFYSSLYIEAHDWLTEKYMELDEQNQKIVGKINDDFFKIKQFEPLYAHVKEKSIRGWRSRFFNGRDIGAMKTKEVKQHIQDNLLAYRLHQEKQKVFLQNKIQAVTNRINECIATQLDDANQYMFWTDILTKEFNFKNKNELRNKRTNRS